MYILFLTAFTCKFPEYTQRIDWQKFMNEYRCEGSYEASIKAIHELLSLAH